MIADLDTLYDKIDESVKKGNCLLNSKNVVERYNGDDWMKYVTFNTNNYTRNIVKRGDAIEMLIICWLKKQQSKIHDHPENGCLMRLLDGEFEEHIYNIDGRSLRKIYTVKQNDIRYQEGNAGIHKIINKDNNSISLHIYSPPNYSAKIYDESQYNIEFLN